MITKLKNHKITRLGGLNNLNYLLECDNKKYVLRIPSKDNRNNFFKENYVITFANLNKLSPTIIYHNEENGILLSEFIENSKVNMATFTSKDFLKNLCKSLKKFHSLNSPYHFNPFYEIRKNLFSLEKFNFKMDKDISLILDKLNYLEEKLTKNKLLGLCHNDLNSSNVLYKNNTVFLLDFEFSAMGDIFFDLATLSWMLDEVERYILLKNYFGYYSYELKEKIEDYLFVVKLWNASWSYLKSINNKSDYDYKLGANMIIDDLLENI